MRKRVLLVSALSILALAGAASAADTFNPQPDPPGRSKGQKPQTVQHQQDRRTNPVHDFNPQPDPPGRSKGQGVQQHTQYRPASRVHDFNPQPDPPGDKHVPPNHATSGSRQVMTALTKASDKPK